MRGVRTENDVFASSVRHVLFENLVKTLGFVESTVQGFIVSFRNVADGVVLAFLILAS